MKYLSGRSKKTEP